MSLSLTNTLNKQALPDLRYLTFVSSFNLSVVEELEKARRDVQKLDNQLIMAVNQKVKLSEQLEQWQVHGLLLIERFVH